MAEAIKNKVKAAVVGGWIQDGNVAQTIKLIGAFDNMAEAFGEAYLYLNDCIAEIGGKEIITITPVHNLESETGYAIYGKDKQNQTVCYAYILCNYNQGGDANGYEDSTPM